eukprot:4528102-Lingulodinium_polyedra.AAC.1
MEFLVRDAYGQIGKSVGQPSAGQVDISETRHKCENLVSVAALSKELLAKTYKEAAADLLRGSAVFLSRHGDSTPVMLRFGSFQQQMLPTARYLKKNDPPTPDGHPSWTTCSFAEYKQLHPKAHPSMGIVEVFAQSILAAGTSADGAETIQELH